MTPETAALAAERLADPFAGPEASAVASGMTLSDEVEPTRLADEHGNTVAREGCDRCSCGCKYWENDRCIDCRSHVSEVDTSEDGELHFDDPMEG